MGVMRIKNLEHNLLKFRGVTEWEGISKTYRIPVPLFAVLANLKKKIKF